MKLPVAGSSLLRAPVLSLECFPGLDTVHVQLEETQQAPELLQRVLQRGPSQQEAVVRFDGRQGLVEERVLVLQSEQRKMST